MEQETELIRRGIFRGRQGELYRVIFNPSNLADRHGKFSQSAPPRRALRDEGIEGYIFELHPCDAAGRPYNDKPAYRFSVRVGGSFKPVPNGDGFYFLDSLTHSKHYDENWFVRAESLNGTSLYRSEIEDWLTRYTELCQAALETELEIS